MFRRIINLFKGFLGLFISGLEKRSPEALLEVEKENLRKQIAKYNQGLSSHAALCERLMTQVTKQEKEAQELRAKTSAHLKAGNREVASQYAMTLQNLNQELEENRSQLRQAEETYKNLVKARDIAIQTAKTKIDELKATIGDLKTKKAMAELTEMASGMISSIGGSGDTIDRLQKMVEEERELAAGKVRVAQSTMEMSEVKIKEAEQKALADQALADFAAKEGIVLEPSASPDAESSASPDQVLKSMGISTEKKE